MIFVSLKYDVFQASDFNFKGQDFLIVINLVIIPSHKLEHIVLCHWFDLRVLRY